MKISTVWPFSRFFNRAPLTAEQLEERRGKRAARRAYYDPAEYLEIVKDEIAAFVPADEYQARRLDVANALYATAMDIYLSGNQWVHPLSLRNGYYTYTKIPGWLWRVQAWLEGVNLNDENEVRTARKSTDGRMIVVLGRITGAEPDGKNYAAATVETAKDLYEKAMAIYLEGNHWARDRYGRGYYRYRDADGLLARIDQVLDRNLAAAA